MKLRQIIQGLKANGQFALVQRRQAKVTSEKPGARKFLADMVFGQGLNIALPTTGGDNPYPPGATVDREALLAELRPTQPQRFFSDLLHTLNASQQYVLQEAACSADTDEVCLTTSLVLFLLFWRQRNFANLTQADLYHLISGINREELDEGIEKLIENKLVIKDGAAIRPLLGKYQANPAIFVDLCLQASRAVNEDLFPLVLRGGTGRKRQRFAQQHHEDFLREISAHRDIMAGLTGELGDFDQMTALERCLMGSIVAAMVEHELTQVSHMRNALRPWTSNQEDYRARVRAACSLYTGTWNEESVVSRFRQRLRYINGVAAAIGFPSRLALYDFEGSQGKRVLATRTATIETRTNIEGREYWALQPVGIGRGQYLEADQIYLGEAVPKFCTYGFADVTGTKAYLTQLPKETSLGLVLYCAQRIAKSKTLSVIMSGRFAELHWARFLVEAELQHHVPDKMNVVLNYSGKDQTGTVWGVDSPEAATLFLLELLVEYPLPGSPVAGLDCHAFSLYVGERGSDTLLATVFQSLIGLPDGRKLLHLPFLLDCLREFKPGTAGVRFDQEKIKNLPVKLDQCFRLSAASVAELHADYQGKITYEDLARAACQYWSEVFDRPAEKPWAEMEMNDLTKMLEEFIIALSIRSGLLDMAEIKAAVMKSFVVAGSGAELAPENLYFGDRPLAQTAQARLAKYFTTQNLLVEVGEDRYALVPEERSGLAVTAKRRHEERLLCLDEEQPGVSWSCNSSNEVLGASYEPLSDLSGLDRESRAALRIMVPVEVVARLAEHGTPFYLEIPGIEVAYCLEPSLLSTSNRAIVTVEQGKVRLSVGAEQLCEDTWKALFNGQEGVVTAGVSRRKLPEVSGRPVRFATNAELLALELLVPHLDQELPTGFRVESGAVLGATDNGGCIVAPAWLANVSESSVESMALDLRLARRKTDQERVALLQQLFQAQPEQDYIKRMESLDRSCAAKMRAIRRIYLTLAKQGINGSSSLALLCRMMLGDKYRVELGLFCVLSEGGLHTEAHCSFEQDRFRGLGAVWQPESKVRVTSGAISFRHREVSSGQTLLYVIERTKQGTVKEAIFTAAGIEFSEHHVLEKELIPLEKKRGVCLDFVRRLGILSARELLQSVDRLLELYDEEVFWQGLDVEPADVPFHSDLTVKQAMIEALAPELVGLNWAQTRTVMQRYFEGLFLIDDVSRDQVKSWIAYVSQVLKIGLRVNRQRLQAGHDEDLTQWATAIEGRLQAAEAVAKQANGQGGSQVVAITPIFRKQVPELESLGHDELVRLMMFFKEREALGQQVAVSEVSELTSAEQSQVRAELKAAVKATTAIAKQDHDPFAALQARISGAGQVFEVMAPRLTGIGRGVEGAITSAVDALAGHTQTSVITPLRMLTELLHDVGNGSKVQRVWDTTPSHRLTGMPLEHLSILAFNWQTYGTKLWVQLVMRQFRDVYGEACVRFSVYGGKRPTLTDFYGGRQELASLRIDLDNRGATVDLSARGGTSEALQQMRAQSGGWHFHNWLPKSLNRAPIFANFVATFDQRVRDKFAGKFA